MANCKLASFNKSLKATWIKKYLDSGNRGKWKNVFNLALGKYGGSHFFELGNLNRKDIDKLKIEDPFIREIVEIWSDTFFERKIVSKDHFLSLPLLQNSLIRYNTIQYNTNFIVNSPWGLFRDKNK